MNDANNFASVSDLSNTNRRKIFDRINRQNESDHLTESPYSKKQLTDLLPIFCQAVERHKGVVVQAPSLDQLPAAVATRMHSLHLNSSFYCGASCPLLELDWASAQLNALTDKFSADGQLVISNAVLGIADTGTVVLTSGNENPTPNNFLAEHHFVVLDGDNMVSYSEAAWYKLKQLFPRLPRTINFISGPSSSADVGLKLEYGAHGPRSLTVFLLNSEGTGESQR